MKTNFITIIMFLENEGNFDNKKSIQWCRRIIMIKSREILRELSRFGFSFHHIKMKIFLHRFHYSCKLNWVKLHCMCMTISWLKIMLESPETIIHQATFYSQFTHTQQPTTSHMFLKRQQKQLRKHWRAFLYILYENFTTVRLKMENRRKIFFCFSHISVAVSVTRESIISVLFLRSLVFFYAIICIEK